MAGKSGRTGASILNFERTVNFSDAVFAIVITLLVLPLTAEVELPESTTDLAGEVWHLWPRAVSFVVGFLVVGQFWAAHHRMFGMVRHLDTGLIWLNLLVLLTVSFMPFPTAVLGEFSSEQDRFPVVFYAASMTVTSVMLSGTWLYAVQRGLVDNALPDAVVARFGRRSWITSAVFVVSIGAAFLGLPVAAAVWLVVLPVARHLAGGGLSSLTEGSNTTTR